MAGNRYSVGLTKTAIGTVEGDVGTTAVGELLGIATQRGWVYDLLFSHGSVAADGTIRWEVPRQTTAATATAAVENNLDLNGRAASLLAAEQVTVGPTVTVDTQILDFDLNQRASFRWVASPDGEIVIPATAAAGIFFNASSTVYAGIARTTVLWVE